MRASISNAMPIEGVKQLVESACGSSKRSGPESFTGLQLSLTSRGLRARVEHGHALRDSLSGIAWYRGISFLNSLSVDRSPVRTGTRNESSAQGGLSAWNRSGR